MKDELEKEIINLAPWMFKGYDKTIMESCLAWGFEHSNGWFKLHKELFTKLAKLDVDHVVQIDQIKEKYGRLTIYFSLTDRDSDVYDKWYYKVDSLINKYERKSIEICEVCGKPGKLNRKGWLSCLCNKCRKNEHKRREEMLNNIKKGK